MRALAIEVLETILRLVGACLVLFKPRVRIANLCLIVETRMAKA